MAGLGPTCSRCRATKARRRSRPVTVSGAAIMVFVLVVGLPVLFTVSGVVIAFILSRSLNQD